jgi:cation:H+ antiporter
LLVAFGLAMAYLIAASQHHRFLDVEEIEEVAEGKRGWPVALGLTVVGIVVIGMGGELVAAGAEQIVATPGVSASLIGMVVTPAAIELEEVIRHGVPTRAGHPEVSAGNLVGTLLYFVLFNLGLIALLTPVDVDPMVRRLDWPVLVGVLTWLAMAFLARGRLGRVEGVVLLGVYGLYVAAHVGGGFS